MRIVQKTREAWSKKNELNERGEALLFLMKLTKNHSFQELSTLFTLGDRTTAQRIFYRILLHYYQNHVNLKTLVDLEGNANEQEIDAMLNEAFERTPLLYKEFLQHFEDPSGLNRQPICINVDATYEDICMPQDINEQKFCFYPPRSKHTIKIINFTDLLGKFIGLLPLATSQSPSSGDAYLTQVYVNLMDSLSSNYFRRVIRGNQHFFVVLVTDS